MKGLMDINSEQTMSSREIAGLTGKRHADVLRDTRKMLGDLGRGERDFRLYYLNSQNREVPEYLLPLSLAGALVSRYDLSTAVKISGMAATTNGILQALREFDIPEEMKDVYVYAMQEVETGNIKLGVSKDPEQRLKQLQVGNSSTLKLVGYRAAPNGRKDEAMQHKLNGVHHVRGEWFSGNAALVH